MKNVIMFVISVFFQWSITISAIVSSLYFFELNRMILTYVISNEFNHVTINVFSFLVTGFTIYAVFEIYNMIFKEK